MLCFSHDWAGDPLSKTHLMRLLARDNRVLWVNSIGYRTPTVSKADASRAFKKLAAATRPLGNPASARAINRHLLKLQVKRAMRKLGFRRPINWVFNPPAAVVAGELGEEQFIYQCVDEYGAFSGVSGRAMAEFEEKLLRMADLAIVSADRLLQ